MMKLPVKLDNLYANDMRRLIEDKKFPSDFTLNPGKTKTVIIYT